MRRLSKMSNAPPGVRRLLTCITACCLMLVAGAVSALPSLPIDYPSRVAVGPSPNQPFQLADVVGAQQQGNTSLLEEVGITMSRTPALSGMNTEQAPGFVIVLPHRVADAEREVRHHLLE